MSNTRIVLAALCVLCAPGAYSLAQADTGAEWRLDTQFATRVNPTGVRVNPNLALRRGLFDSGHMLLKDAYIEVGTAAPFTPVSIFNQVYVEAVPIAPLLFRASATHLRYFGVLGVIKEFANGDTNWSPAVLDEAMDEGGGVSTTGTDAMLMAKLRLKFGKVLATASYEQHWISLEIPNSSNWYDPYNDLLFAQADQFTLTTGFAGYVASGDLSGEEFLLVGAKYEGFATERSDMQRQLANLLVVWRPGWRAQDKLTVGTVLGYYLEDPYREGEVLVAAFANVSWGGPLSE